MNPLGCFELCKFNQESILLKCNTNLLGKKIYYNEVKRKNIQDNKF